MGNALPIANIPLGTTIHNIELIPGKGGQIVRSAGTSAQLLAKEGDFAQVRLPSGEVRRVPLRCMATIGQVWQPRPREPEPRQGRARPPHGPASGGPGRRDDPAGPSARRRRGQEPHGHAAQDAVGQARHGLPDAARQGHEPPHRPQPASQVISEELEHVAIGQEGTVRPAPASRPRAGHEQAERAQGAEDLVARLRHLPRLHRAHHRRLQRQEARARCTSPRTWSATDSASSRPPARIAGTARTADRSGGLR